MDDDSRFTLGSDEFKALIGPQTAAALGQPWSDIAAALGLDPEGQVARAFASRDTWSGITVAFPVDGTDARLAVELSGLAGVRPRPQLPRLPRLRRLPRRRAHQRTDADAPRRRRPPPRASSRRCSARSARRCRVPPPVNVVPFPASAPAGRRAGADAGRAQRVQRTGEPPHRAAARPRQGQAGAADDSRAAGAPSRRRRDCRREAAGRARRAEAEAAAPPRTPAADQRPILDRLPVGVLVYRLDKLIYANRAFLDWTGYDQLHALEEAGGLDALFVEPNNDEPGANNGAQVAHHRHQPGRPGAGRGAAVHLAVGGRIRAGADADRRRQHGGGDDRQKTFETALRHAKAEVGEVRDILDAAADGVVVLDRDAPACIRSIAAPRSCSAMQSRELTGLPFASLFAPESQRDVLEALDGAGKPGSRDRAQRPRRHRPPPRGRPGPAVHDAVARSTTAATSSAPSSAT